MTVREKQIEEIRTKIAAMYAEADKCVPTPAGSALKCIYLDAAQAMERLRTRVEKEMRFEPITRPPSGQQESSC